MHHSYKKKVVEWLQSESVENILRELDDVKVAINCYECESSKEVKVINWEDKGNIFWCISCLLKVRKDGLPVSEVKGNLRTRFLVFERDGFKCVYCGRNPQENDTRLEVEHVHPSSKGGSDRLSNLVTACRECNAGKGDIILNERSIQKIKPDRW